MSCMNFENKNYKNFYKYNQNFKKCVLIKQKTNIINSFAEIKFNNKCYFSNQAITRIRNTEQFQKCVYMI